MGLSYFHCILIVLGFMKFEEVSSAKVQLATMHYQDSVATIIQ